MVTLTFSGDWEELTVAAEGHAARPEVCAAVSMLLQAMEAWTLEGGLCQLHSGGKGEMKLSCLHTDESYAAAGLVLCGARLLAAAYPGEVALKVEGEIYPMGELCLDRFGEAAGTDAGDSAASPSEAEGPDMAGAETPSPQIEGASAPETVGGTAGDSAAADGPAEARAARTGPDAAAVAETITAELGRRSRDRLIREMVRSPGIIADGLLRQSAALGQTYGDFSLEEELQNPRFRRLVKGGATLREAYEALHTHRVRAAAEQEALRRIAARRLRPPENGAARAVGALSGGAAALTPADRDALARRALAGETISF